LISRSQNPKSRLQSDLRVYAVGDIHGRADLLSSILSRIDVDLERFPIAQSVQVFLGDYIDRGAHSCDVLDLLIDRRKRDMIVCLKGNHEAYVMRVLSNPSLMSRWREFGGDSTLLSYGVVSPMTENQHELESAVGALQRALPESHHHFLQSLALSFTCGDYFFAHAGVRPRIPLERQSQRDLLWIRDDFLRCQDDFGKIVVHGHTPIAEPDIRPNRINIDTGAYASGRLTCLVLESDQTRFL
jgi:serine/threonine protein phosphatase 1